MAEAGRSSRCRGRDVLLVTGGLGLAPMRPVVRALLADRCPYGRVILLHGARQPVDLLYAAEYSEWERLGLELLITVDRAELAWHGQVGVVPLLFHRLKIDAERTVMLTCGPEILMRFAVTEALDRGDRAKQIFTIRWNGTCSARSACAAIASSGRRSFARTARSLPTVRSRRFFARICYMQGCSRSLPARSHEY